MIELKLQIEDLIEKSSNDFEISKLIKSSINDYFNSIDVLLDSSNGKEFLVKHTKKIDEFLVILIKYILRKYFGSYLPLGSLPINIVAMGSYGREQLCIYSDVDLLILYEDIKGYNLKPIIEEFVTILWDCGLKLGSRVHDIKELFLNVNEDVTIKTSLFESRLIYGSKYLWFSYQALLKRIRSSNQKDFILKKLEEHRIRLLKYPLKNEPNIKDGYGGIRESNMLFWVATVLYGVSNVKNLINIYFNEEEYKKYRVALEYIFQIRTLLHLISRKKVDVVNFDLLPELSLKLGFKDTLYHTKEIQCLSKLFNSLHTIHFFTNATIKKLTKKIFFGEISITTLKECRYKKNLYIIDNILFTSFHKKPTTITKFLKELIQLPHTIKSFDRTYIYYASKTNLTQKNSEENSRLIKLLLNKKELYPTIKLLYNANLFEHIFPIAKKAINLPQFDGYHQHSVDIHSLNALKHLENIKDSFVLQIYNRLTPNQKTLAKIATLFHDVGKGRREDHHIVGERLFKSMAKTLNFTLDETQMVTKIIRYHNLMSKVATNEDIYSQKVVLEFIATIKNRLFLDILYVLTYADISAVDNHTYNSSTALLLKKLYQESLQAFDNAELLNESVRRITKINSIKKLHSYKELPNTMKKRVSYISSNQIFLQLKANEILELAIKANSIDTYNYEIRNEDVLYIRIIKAIPINLGYLLGKLEFLNITNMNIFKLFDEKKCYEIIFSESVEVNDLSIIEEIIINSFDMNKIVKLKEPKIYENEIIIDHNHSQNLASMKIKTKDQKGLLAYITKILEDFSIKIESAKLYTSRGKTRDLFLVEKNENFSIKAEEIKRLICKNSKE